MANPSRTSSLILLAALLVAPHAVPAAPETVAFGGFLALRGVTRGGRGALHVDPVEAAIVAGTWLPPRAGEEARLLDGTPRTWTSAEPGMDGSLAGPGYLFTSVTVAAPKVMLLEASGHDLVYVNGEPRMGDTYGYGYVRLPVALEKGANSFLFLASRGRLKARLVEPESAAFLNVADSTLPDAVLGEPLRAPAAVVVGNCTTRPLDGVYLRAGLHPTGSLQRLPAIPPLSVRKVAFELNDRAPAGGETLTYTLRLEKVDSGEPKPLAEAPITVRVRKKEDVQKRTFRSAIDGSVQYYAVNPARPGGPAPALFLSLHGASVEAVGQAAAYSPKNWGHLVAPTNRRPYGFDWEDWGRLDALEVLEHARRSLKTDPTRTYLIGHSMGGHGTWHLGALFPDRFAAIGPSAGWISFMSYGGGSAPTSPTPGEAMLLRAAATSDTLALLPNYAPEGVYILHGDADDNVPVREARTMREKLAAFHKDLQWHEQPGAGHWWDASDEPGADCVDWAPMFDFLSRRALPPAGSVRQVDFTTVNPAVSARSHWLGIEAQLQALKPSRATVRFDPLKRRFVGTTQNVARLALNLGPLRPEGDVSVELDGKKLEGLQPPRGEDAVLYLERKGDDWAALTASPSPDLKGPRRSGPFKDAFRHRMVFVYGTRGTREENAWAFAKARFDAEQFWYRGNGSVDVITDTAFRPADDADRSVVLYGNAETNAAWKPLLGEGPVQVTKGQVAVGSREMKGDDLACVFLRPRPGSDVACVAAVSGSGLRGMRLADRLPYLRSGSGFPDLLVLGPESLTRGAEGIRVAGFFGNDWSVERGELAWKE